jgi:multidrug resistance efflux pump
MTENDIDIRSEEVQELLGTPPPWMVRWGMLFALICMVLLVAILYGMPFPETVNTTIRIQRENPGVELVAQQGGYVKAVLAETEDSVRAMQAIVAFQAQGNYADVLILEEQLMYLDKDSDSLLVQYRMPTDLIVGELQEALYNFVAKQEAVRRMDAGDLGDMSLDQIRGEIQKEERQIADERRRKRQLEVERVSIDEIYIREQNLYQSGRGDYSELRRAQTNKSQWDRYIQDAETSIKTRQANITFLRNQLKNTTALSQGSKRNELSQLKSAYKTLSVAVQDWKQRYMATSPIDGVVILDDIKEQKYIEAGKRVAVVLPSATSNLIGKATLDLNQSGQVAEGQKVIVDFYSFPAQQYGAVEGIVQKKSKIPTQDDKLAIEVRFPNGLVTSTGRKLEVGQDMAGKMTIIIQEKRLVEWLLSRS